jgi:hypothetical protein
VSERTIDVGKNVADLLLLLQQNRAQAERDLSMAFTVLVKTEDLPDATRLLRIERDAVVVDVPEG